jgi:hypothetical protein
MNEENKILVGSIELCDLPELEISNLNIRVDTGAKTSSLHVDNIAEFSRNDVKWVGFDIHPDIHDVQKIVRREAKVKSERVIKSSNATKQPRYVIETTLVLAGRSWKIQLTLSDRSDMTYLMLLGREAMKGRVIVDPGEEFLLSK